MAIVCLCLCHGTVHATDSNEYILLTVDKSIAFSLENNSDLQIALHQVEAAKAEYREKKTLFFPRLLGQADLVRGDGPASDALNFNQAKLSLIQPLFTSGHFRGEVRQTQALWALAQRNVEELQNAIACETKIVYAEVLQAREIVHVLQENVQRLESMEATVGQRVMTRSAIKLDLLKTAAQLQYQKNNLLDAQAGLRFCEIKFNRGLGRGAEEIVNLDKLGIVPDTDLKTLDFYLQLAQAHRSVSAIAQNEITVAEMEMALARAERGPQVFVQGNYGYSGRQFSNLEKDWSGQASAVLPLWSAGKSKHRIGHARSSVAQAKIRAMEVRTKLEDEVIKAYLDVQSAEAKRVTARKTLEAEEEGWRVVEALYREGNATTVDLLKAQGDWTQARIDCAKAIFGWFTSHAILNKSVGKGINQSDPNLE